MCLPVGYRHEIMEAHIRMGAEGAFAVISCTRVSCHHIGKSALHGFAGNPLTCMSSRRSSKSVSQLL